MSLPSPRATVDITREVCPVTYVRVKLALEQLGQGQVLEVLLRGDEPLRNVPRSAVEDGHRVLFTGEAGGGAHRLLIEAGHGQL